MEFQPIFIKRYYRISDKGNQLIKGGISERNLSRTKLASLTGVSDSYVEHLIRNDRNFREDQLQRILPFLPPNFSSNYLFPQDTIHGKFINLPRQSSPELMQIIGYFLGDGNLQNRSLRFKDTNRDVLKVYQRLIEKVFNVRGRIVSQKRTIAHLLEVNSFYLKNWLKENIILRKNEFLREVKQLSQKEGAAFLKGLFDAEGYVAIQSRQIRLGITDKEIGRVLPFLLSKLGIPSSFYQIKRREPNWSDVYLVSLNSYESFEKFSKFVGFSSREKVKKLKSLIKKKVQIKNN